MAKILKSNLQMQFVESWMATRCYAQASSYDTDYLLLAHSVLDVLQEYSFYFKTLGFGKSDLVPLSTIIVAYFEDFINEVGFWKVFVIYNHERFGTYLPFYQMVDDYDPAPKEAFAAQSKVYQAISEEITGKPAKELPPIAFDGFDKNQPLAMYYVPGQGISYCPYTPHVIDYVLHPKTNKHSRNEITNTLFHQIHPFVVDYILHHYPTEPLGWEGMSLDVVKEAKFLSTYFIPEEAGPSVPSITFVDSSF